MSKNIAIIQGHPDPAGGHYCNALADTYARGAEAAGHTVARIEVAALDIPYLESREQWLASPPEVVMPARDKIAAANHLVIVYPLWMGTTPAKLQSFLEQMSCAGFVVDERPGGKWVQNFKGKSGRIIVTMGMPGQVYRWYFGAHALKNLERNILKFGGVAPVRETLIGLVEALGDDKRKAILNKIEKLGARAE